MDAREIKTIIADLIAKKKEGRGMIDRLNALIHQEKFTEAGALQTKYDRLRFDSTKEYKNLPRFLKEHEVSVVS